MNNIKLVSDTIDKQDIQKLVQWLSADEIPRLTKGEKTLEFELKWSNWLGVHHTTYVNSGSSAILLALAALKELGIKNNKVVVPTLSWLTDVSSVMQLGMQPVLVDCNLLDLSVDLEMLEETFIKESPAVFILVSVLGLVPNMKKIVELCKKYDVKLIEDVCESMGSKFNNQKLGTFGDVGLFSLYYGHHLSTIEGGLICTKNSDLHWIINAMRSHGWDRDWPKERQTQFRQKHNVAPFDSLYTFYYPGFNVRATDLQAFLGLSQIDKIDTFAEKRNRNFHLYLTKLPYNMLRINENKSDFVSNFAFPYMSKNRTKIVSELQLAGVEIRPLIAGSLGSKPFWYERYGKIEMPNADKINELGFYLPNHQDLTPENIELITKIINTIELQGNL